MTRSRFNSCRCCHGAESCAVLGAEHQSGTPAGEPCIAKLLLCILQYLSFRHLEVNIRAAAGAGAVLLLAAIIPSVTLYLRLPSVIVVPFPHPPLVTSSTNLCVPCLLGLTDDEAFPNELPHFLLGPYCAEIANPSCQSDIRLTYGSQTSLPKHVARPERRGAVPAMIRELS